MILFLLPLTPALSHKGRGVWGSIFDKGLFGAEIAEPAEKKSNFKILWFDHH